MKMALLLCAALPLGGCVSMWDVGAKQNGDALSISETPTRPSQVDKKVYSGEELDEAQAKMLAYALLDASDKNCEDYLIGVSYTNNVIASGLDIAALTLSSISPLTTPARNAGILSAGSAVSQHVKQTLSTDILGGKDFALLYAAVIDGRAAERKQIETAVDGGKYTHWTADAIVAQMQPYHFKCGINFALHYLSETLETQSHAASATAPDPLTVASKADDAAKAADVKAAAADKAAASAKADAAQLAAKAKASDAAAKKAKGTPGEAAAVAAATADDQKAKAAQATADNLAKADVAANASAKSARDAASKADDAATADAVAKAAAATSDVTTKKAQPAVATD